MTEIKDNNILMQILDLLDTMFSAGIELMERFGAGDMVMSERLLGDLRTATDTVGHAQHSLFPQLEHACTTEMLENVEDTLDCIILEIQGHATKRTAELIEFQLLPFFRMLHEAFYFWGAVYPEHERMKQYYREEFASHYRNWYMQNGEPFPYRLSVVVMGYNHLETTKLCIEQLLRETDFETLNAELILIDHGSTDGTLEYFESLKIGKVIHFKRNVRMYMFAMLPQICHGEYFCFVSNDVLVTHRWAEILLNCMDSDASIIAAVPATPNTSNYQWMRPVINDPEAFAAWASMQNHSDPALWNDRARIMPNLGMYRTKAVSEVGFADPLFYTMEFWDDDFSFRARRSGYRQIVCDDVACFHFGSVTGKEAQKKESTLVFGRKLFQQKNGVDPWGNGFCYDYVAKQLFHQALPSKGEVNLLALDCGMGDTPLQIRNELRHQHCSCEIYQLTSQKEYLPDQRPFSQEVLFIPQLSEGMDTAFAGMRFSCVYLGRDISQYENHLQLLESLAGRTVPGGQAVLFCENPFFALNLHSMLQFTLPENAERYAVVSPKQIKAQLEKCFSEVQMIPMESAVAGVEQFVAQHFGKVRQSSQIIRELQTKRYYFLCRK